MIRLTLLLLLLPAAAFAQCGRREDVSTWEPDKRDALADNIRTCLTMGVVNIHSSQGQHGSPNFIPWHRQYLGSLESCIAGLTGDPTYLLPKWNPADPVPPELDMIDPDCPGNCPPLEDLIPSFGRPKPLFDVDTCSDPYTSLSHLQTGDQGSWINCETNAYAGNPGLEAWHGCIHVRVGGTMGQIGNSPGAILFWLWHSFVDDVGWCWCNCLPQGQRQQCLTYIPPPRPYENDCLDRLVYGLYELPQYYGIYDDVRYMLRPAREAYGYNYYNRYGKAPDDDDHEYPIPPIPVYNYSKLLPKPDADTDSRAINLRADVVSGIDDGIRNRYNISMVYQPPNDQEYGPPPERRQYDPTYDYDATVLRNLVDIRAYSYRRMREDPYNGYAYHIINSHAYRCIRDRYDPCIPDEYRPPTYPPPTYSGPDDYEPPNYPPRYEPQPYEPDPYDPYKPFEPDPTSPPTMKPTKRKPPRVIIKNVCRNKVVDKCKWTGRRCVPKAVPKPPPCSGCGCYNTRSACRSTKTRLRKCKWFRGKCRNNTRRA